jgi:hypothetical protein
MLDYSYQRQLELEQHARRGLADVATSRRRAELQLAALQQPEAKLHGQAQQARQPAVCAGCPQRGPRRRRRAGARNLWALPGRVADRLTGGMFVASQVQAQVSLALAQARLAHLVRAGGLLDASHAAYEAGLAGLVLAAPPGGLPQVAGLVRVHSGDLITRGDSVHAALRWEATAPGGEPFPALDADLTLSPARDQTTTVTLAGGVPAAAGHRRQRARPGSCPPRCHDNDPGVPGPRRRRHHRSRPGS